MKNEGKLSTTSNMSLGYIPIILTILLSEFIHTDQAVYIGAATGVLLTAVFFFNSTPRVIHFMALASTVMLTAFSVIALIMGGENIWPQRFFPITLEIAMIIPLLLLFMNRKRYYQQAHKARESGELKRRTRLKALTQSSIRMFFKLTTFHFAFIAVGLVITHSLDNPYMRFCLYWGPLIVFLLSILIGYLEIKLLQTVDDPEYIPVMTPEGAVVGKVDKKQAEEYKNEFTNPIIRVAAISYNMLFLCQRPESRIIDKGKVDTPLETYLLFKETITEGVERLLKENFPTKWESLAPHFSIKYKFRNNDTNRIVYLFILDLGKEDHILRDPTGFDNCKLWTSGQIDLNLGKGYFSEMFENEYDHLKFILDTRERYKESSTGQEPVSSNP